MTMGRGWIRSFIFLLIGRAEWFTTCMNSLVYLKPRIDVDNFNSIPIPLPGIPVREDSILTAFYKVLHSVICEVAILVLSLGNKGILIPQSDFLYLSLKT